MTIPRLRSFVKRSGLEDVLVVKGHGLSRSLLDKHPPPDQLENPELITEFEEASRYHSVTTNHQQQCSVSPPHEGCQSFTDTSTGNTTDRSSVDDPFWGNDESERKAARKIQQLFDQIDHVLYERQAHEGPEHLFLECAEWSFQFPHLRILGHQLLPSQEKGYDEIPRISHSRPSTASTVENEHSHTDGLVPAESDFQLLNVTGKPAGLLQSQKLSRSGARSSSSLGSQTSIFEAEEVIEKDGDIEEIIAVDYPDRLDSFPDRRRHCTSSSRYHRTGYPPITPLACVRESIASATFDYTWNEVLAWMRNLLSMYFEYVLAVGKPLLVPLPSYRTETNNLSREPSSMFNYQKISLPTRNHTFITSSASWKLQSLDGILTVKQKDIVERPGSILHDTSDVGLPPPSSSNSNSPQQGFKVFRPGSVKYNRLIKPWRLAPLQDRSKTPSVYEEVLKVTKLMPAGSESQSSPPGFLGSRNGCLPPICTDVSFDTPIIRPQRRTCGAFSSRVSSAVGDKDLRGSILQRERSGLSVEARPNTTHAMARSDTPFGPLFTRRSSTPPWQQTLGPRGHSTVASQNVNLGISGSSLQPSIIGEIHPHMSLPQADIPEADELHSEEIVCTSLAPTATSTKTMRRSQAYSPTVQS